MTNSERDSRVVQNGVYNAIELSHVAMQRLSGVLLLLVLIVWSTPANAGLRGSGKYSGVVIFDRWDGCILFSGVYLTYVSEEVKEQLRPFSGQAIEIDAMKVFQPVNPGDGLIRELKVLGPAKPSERPFTFDGIELSAQPEGQGSEIGVVLTISNDNDTVARIDSSEIGFAVLSEKIGAEKADRGLTPSDGPSIAVITRANVLLGKGTWGHGIAGKMYSYSYVIDNDEKLPRTFELAAHESRSTRIAFQLPAGHYQFFAGYGGGVHESKLSVNNPVSIDIP